MKENTKLRVTGLCEGNPPVASGFPSQRASNKENVSILLHYDHPHTELGLYALKHWQVWNKLLKPDKSIIYLRYMRLIVQAKTEVYGDKNFLILCYIHVKAHF